MNNKSGRTEIARRSLAIIENGYYTTADGGRVNVKDKIEKSVAQTRTYDPGEMADLKNKVLALNKASFDTKIEVWNTTTIEALSKMDPAARTAILNFASAKNPGGGFLGGASAQEESLARSSGLYAALSKDMSMYTYNRSRSTLLYSDHLIYSPETVFWFDDEGDLLPELLIADVITSPAPNRGAIEQNNRKEELALLPQVFKERMAQVLAVACAHQCESLILGAWGCGVFRNDPAEVARYFGEVIHSHFSNVFKTIVFAVYDRSKDGANIQAFESVWQHDKAGEHEK